MVQSRGPCCVLGRCAVPARTPGAGIGRKPHAAHADVHQATEPRHALVDVASDGDATAGGREAGFAHARLARVRSVRTDVPRRALRQPRGERSEEHTSELQSLMRISYAVFCLKKKINKTNTTGTYTAKYRCENEES